MMMILLPIAISFITVFAAWWDYKTYQRWFRGFLIFLSGLMLLAFVMQPNILSSAQTANYAFITDGADLSALSTAHYDSVFTLQERDLSSGNSQKNIQWLSSASMISRHVTAGNSLDIYGVGTDEPLPDNYQWIDKLTLPEYGFILNTAPQEVEIGKPFTLNFQLESAAERDSLVIIRDGTALATVFADSSGKLEVQDQLFSEGPVHYQLDWIREDSVVTENWNIRAVQPERLSIGMLLYSPLFEMNYLAESLSEKNHHIAVRTRIGRDRFRYDDLNLPAVSAENILSNPAAFDFLILDIREFQQLQPTEKSRMIEALKNGLDILLTPPDTENLEEWERDFQEITGQTISFERLNRLEERLWVPDFVDPNLLEMNRIPVMNLNFGTFSEEMTPLLFSQNREPVSVRLNVENGSVSTHLFYQSYNWLLAGQPEIYHQFWADYLGNLITLEQSFLNVTTQIPRIDQPVNLTFTSQRAPLTIRSLSDGATITLPVINRQEHPNIGSATFWPKNPGWHLAELEKNRCWFYIYTSGWKFDDDYQAFRNTKHQIANQNFDAHFSDSSKKRKVPDWIWLISFLGLQSFLWIERKVG